MVESILAQICVELECIIVDDDPTLSSGNYLSEKYAQHPNVRYIRNAYNKGVASASNVGLHLASGEYIAFVGDDDFFIDKMFANAAKNILDKNLDVDSVFSGVYGFNESGGRYLSKTFASCISFSELLISNGIIFGSCIIHRKLSVLRVNGFDPACKTGTDSDLFRRMLRDGSKIVGLQRLSLFYDNRDHVVRMSAPDNLARLDIRRKAFLERIVAYNTYLTRSQKAELNYRMLLIDLHMREIKNENYHNYDLVIYLLYRHPLSITWVKLLTKILVRKIRWKQ